jgi:4-hydroxy-3-polyprenylbenzoate decarboxylase
MIDPMREFLDRLHERGDLVRIQEEVDWNVEAGAIMRRANEIGAPAQLFEKLKGYPKGYRLLGGGLSTFSRLAVAMGLAPDSEYSFLVDEFVRRSAHPIKPMVVGSGPCKENVMIGDEVDLFKFPVPFLHPQDGGRFLGTLNVGVCKDPDSDWVNWGTYRAMVHDRRTTGIYLGPLNHGGILLRKHSERNLPMDYAIFMGSAPVTYLVATSGIPYGVNEVDIVGGFRGEPVPLVKCETSDLMVPADAEIVIEGVVQPGEKRAEGPFGEYPGYVVSGVLERPVFRVKAVTHRNDPILTATCLGVPTDEGHVLCGVAYAAEFKIALQRQGVPFKQIYIPPEAGLHTVVVSTKPPHHGVPFLIASTIWNDRNGRYVPKVIVVEDDVDPSNLAQVFHALSTKCQPIQGITRLEGVLNCPLTPYLPPKTRDVGIGGGYLLLDCTYPVQWKEEDKPKLISFAAAYPQEVQRRVLENWKQYGFPS